MGCLAAADPAAGGSDQSVGRNRQHGRQLWVAHHSVRGGGGHTPGRCASVDLSCPVLSVWLPAG